MADGLHVCHDGKTWRDGQLADVPSVVAKQWIAWVGVRAAEDG
ncbi:hypothetical protein [Mycobacterium sp. URHB0021]